MTVDASDPRRALVVGVTGIAGQAAARLLLDDGWEVWGLSRSGGAPVAGVTPVAADLGDRDDLRRALDGVEPAVVVYTAWTRQDTEAENIAVNGAAVANLLEVVGEQGSLRHASLMTGLKHYLGPFEAYGQGDMPDTPFREEVGRLDVANFYYAQEDELMAAAQRHGFTWSVHRAHTVLGFATGNAMNMVATIGAYATLCRDRGEPMVFPGTRVQWDGVTDVTDVELLAEQMLWAARTPAAADEAFNIANGDVFRWRWLWPQVAEHFGVAWEGPGEEVRPLEDAMAGTEDRWRELAAEQGLSEPDLSRVASWWHTDADLGRPIEVLTDMNKSRRAGFTATRDTRDAFFSHVARYREAGVLP